VKRSRVALLLLLCVTPSFALDREAFAFAKYNLDVRVESAQHRLAVRGTITLRNDSTTPQKNLALQISSSLTWRSIRLNGQPLDFVAQPYASDIDHTAALSEAILTLAQSVPPQATIQLEVAYEGVIVQDATRLTRIGAPEDLASHGDWDQISRNFIGVRGIGYVAWYPMATESANLSVENSVFETTARWKKREAGAEFSINLCSDVAATQTESSTANEAENCTTIRFDNLTVTEPVLISAPYAQLDRDSVTINYFPEHKEGAENFAIAADLATPLVEAWFGPQKSKAAVSELLDSDDAAFENGSQLLSALKNTDSRLYRSTAVHQLTHAAFASPRPWIFEGLAHFAQALFQEQIDERDSALTFLDGRLPQLVEAEKAAHGLPDDPLRDSFNEAFYRTKAMFVWWMLRDMIGDEALKKALAAYRSSEDRDPAYMQRLIQAQTQRDLTAFFDDWLNHDRGLPDFKVDTVNVIPAPAGAEVVTISIANLGDAGADVPVYLHVGENVITRKVEVRGKSKAVVRIEAPAHASKIDINDGSVPESDLTNNTYKLKDVVPTGKK